MRLKSIELAGFKSFAKKTQLEFTSSITSIVGPNGSGKSNIAESFRFVLGEQSMKSMRGKRGEDMIWNGSQAVPRAGRASVKLVFDNTDRALNLDFDEVAIERVVHRDGGNDYLLNGSSVRLRDVSELLAQANIGASGHHIISQGEADRILTASPAERREVLEDALGLTAYLYKREEAKKKLEKTAENIREVEGLRRELAPHLRFLQSQMRKIEEAQKLRDDVQEKYLEYLKRESVYLDISKSLLKEDREQPEGEHQALEQKIMQLRSDLGVKHHDAKTDELMHLEEEGRTTLGRRSTVQRELGRIEGELAAHERLSHAVVSSVPANQVQEFIAKIESELEGILSLDLESARTRLRALGTMAKEFLQRVTHREATAEHTPQELSQKKKELEAELEHLQQKETDVATGVQALRQKIEGEKDASREAERELFAAMARRSELQTKLSQFRAQEETLERDSTSFKNELGEAAALVGRAIASYEEYEVREAGEVVSRAEMADEPRELQLERRRKIERIKIRLEEAGLGSGAEVIKEHQETTERDQFLARELSDLDASAQSLHTLIDELTKTLEVRFTEGLHKINTEFDGFFKLMFGGGTASLVVVEEKKRGRAEDNDAPVEEGIDIAISLPHKRLKGLHMLSGGERALTSIALIFAMSQVNPPPFLILDETDAALDEANSRRYGDMIETLAKQSQLIVITHNRETMSRAGVLYGITMGGDGISKLLSIKFEDALAVAK